MRLQAIALRCDGRPVSVAEVLAGSVLGGFGQALIRRAADDLAAVPAAAAKGLATSGDDIQEALDGWRTERDLIAADEFRAWMETEELDLGRIASWLDSELLRERLEAGSRVALDAHQPVMAEVMAALHVTAALGAELPALSEQLALRLVAPVPGAEAAESIAAARAGLLGKAGCASVGEAVALLEPLAVDERSVSALLDAELAFRLFSDRLAGDELIQEELAAHQEALVRFDVAKASFPSEDVALEVLCCVREDGDSFRRSAARAGEPFSRASVLGVDLPARLFGNRLFAAKAKDIFGPEEAEGRHHVAQLLRKVEPDLRSESVRDELTDRVVSRALRRDVNDRVVFAMEDAA